MPPHRTATPRPHHAKATLPNQRVSATRRSHRENRAATCRRQCDAVFERDGNRCAYVDVRGGRCRETQRLAIHHHEPFARGGSTTPENLSLYCAAHNTLVAESDFGREFSLEKRDSHTDFTERTLARATSQLNSPSR